VHLRDQLSNFSPSLVRLTTALASGSRSGRGAASAAVAQSGAVGEDAARVRLSLLRVNHKLTVSEIDELVVAYEGGASLRSLAARFALHEQTVRAHLKRRKVVTRPVGCSLSETQRSNLIETYMSGSSMTALARTYGVSVDTVHRWLVKAGVPIRPRNWRPPAL
jgi:Mor family transcriptional regulator